MKRATRYFLSGLLFVAPAGLTVYVMVMAFTGVDGLLAPLEERVFGRQIPGVGFAAVVAGIFLVGLLASNFLTRRLFRLANRVFEKLPLVKLLYSSIRDLLDAFVGEKKRFDRPVTLKLFPGSDARVLGFITREDLSALGLEGDVAVYVPQSYNFAGNLVVVPRSGVTPLNVGAGALMAFIVSGGISVGEPGAAGPETGRLPAQAPS